MSRVFSQEVDGIYQGFCRQDEKYREGVLAMDVLSEILDSIRLREATYFRSDLAAPWGIESDTTAYGQFHWVAQGNCWFQCATEGRPVRLAPGDLVLLPLGHAHWLADKPGSGRTAAHDVTRALREGKTIFGGNGPRTTLVCGYFRFDRKLCSPLLRRLPPCIHMTDTARRQLSWLDAATAILASELGSSEPGSAALTDRIAEGIFIHVLRAHLLEQRATRNELSALNDPQIARALRLLHERIEMRWTIEGLAQKVGMSRAVLARRFRELVGSSLMQYLGEQRMVRARRYIVTTARPLSAIAGAVGFGSVPAFTRAFKRRFGENPGQLRRSCQNQSPYRSQPWFVSLRTPDPLGASLARSAHP